jgi:hypothetical protein
MKNKQRNVKSKIELPKQAKNKKAKPLLLSHWSNLFYSLRKNRWEIVQIEKGETKNRQNSEADEVTGLFWRH